MTLSTKYRGVPVSYTHLNRIEPPVSLPKTMRDTVVERVLDPILDPQHRVDVYKRQI